MSAQYALSLSLPPLYSADNFFVSDCNREAWQWIEAWPKWPAHALLLSGPSGSGKTHLGHVWAAHAKASIIDAAVATIPEPVSGNILIENTERLSDERSLLHLFNYTKENKHSLLLTSAVAATQLPFTLPDLTSRLRAIPSASIAQPDDAVLAASLRKQFADRQMKVDEEVIAYILPRMERSLTKATELVTLLDEQAMAEKKNIKIAFVKRLLEQL